MITKALSIYGMGDALNQRAFLATYCQQKNIPRGSISIYTEKHWWMFDGMGFKRGEKREDFKKLVAYRNFGFYDLPFIKCNPKLDECIAQNAGIKYNFDVCVPLPKYEMPNVDLPERYITFNTGFGDFSGKPGQKDIICFKSWPTEYWKEFVKTVGIPCVQVGAGPSCEIIPGAINLVDKLKIQESAEVMRKGLFHVDMEGGLPILNQHLGKKSVVLFGPTAIENQGRTFNLNIRNCKCHPCYEWGSNKMVSLYSHKNNLICGVKCMKDIKPEYVINEIKKNKWL